MKWRDVIYLNKNTLMIKKIHVLKKMEAQTKKTQEMFHKELEDIKNKQLNNTITEIKNITRTNQ